MQKSSIRSRCCGLSGRGGSSDGEEKRKWGFVQFRSQDQRLLCPDTPLQIQTFYRREKAEVSDCSPSFRPISLTLGSREFQGNENSKSKSNKLRRTGILKSKKINHLAGVAELIDQMEQVFQVSISKYL